MAFNLDIPLRIQKPGQSMGGARHGVAGRAEPDGARENRAGRRESRRGERNERGAAELWQRRTERLWFDLFPDMPCMKRVYRDK